MLAVRADEEERALERLDTDAVRRRQRSKLVRTRRPILGGQVAQLRALDELGPETEVERRATALAELDVRDDQAFLTVDGTTLSFPVRVAGELEFVLAAEGPFRPADLPGRLDADGRLVLVGRLVREGLLRITDA